MSDEVECMCLECGISLYLAGINIPFEHFSGEAKQPLPNIYCTECGGALVVVGKKGDEPQYRLKD